MEPRRTLPPAALRTPRRRRRRRGPPRLLLEALAFRLAYAGVSRLPLGAAYRGLETALLLFFRLTRKYRERGLASLEIAYPHASPAWRWALLRRSLRHLAWYFVDTVRAPALLRQPRYRAAVDVTPLQELFRRHGVGRGTGALVVTGHIGPAEVASLAAAAAGIHHAVIARPLDNPRIQAFLERLRAPYGRPVLAKKGALRKAYRLLRARGVVALQIDQDARQGGVFVPYFGVLASTYPGAAQLALLTGVPVFVLACVRTAPRRFRFRLEVEGPVPLPRTGDHARDVAALTARLTARIEALARRFPEQVMWCHRRWKTRPPGETDGGP